MRVLRRASRRAGRERGHDAGSSAFGRFWYDFIVGDDIQNFEYPNPDYHLKHYYLLTFQRSPRYQMNL